MVKIVGMYSEEMLMRKWRKLVGWRTEERFSTTARKASLSDLELSLKLNQVIQLFSEMLLG